MFSSSYKPLHIHRNRKLLFHNTHLSHLLGEPDAVLGELGALRIEHTEETVSQWAQASNVGYSVTKVRDYTNHHANQVNSCSIFSTFFSKTCPNAEEEISKNYCWERREKDVSGKTGFKIQSCLK